MATKTQQRKAANTVIANMSDLYAKAQRKFEHVRYLVRQAVNTDVDEVWGVIIYGDGGCGKSFAVLDELDRLGRKHELINSQLTGRGCRDKLADNPYGIFVIEEVEKALRSDKDDVSGVLRSATYGQKGKDGRRRRTVAWGTAQGLQPFEFHGSIIIVSNLPIKNNASLRALASRFSLFEMSLTNEELLSCAYTWSREGHRNSNAEMTAAECWAVLDVMAEEFESHKVTFDLRLIEHAYADCFCWRDDEKNRLMAWESVVSMRIEQRAAMMINAADAKYAGGKREQQYRAQEEAFLRIIKHTDDRGEQVALFIQEGYSRPTFYRTARRLGFDFDSK